MIITEDDKKRVIDIANYLVVCEEIAKGDSHIVEYWYEKAAVVYYISNGLSRETSKEMAKLMVEELKKESKLIRK
jgi:hypothetical protein